MVTATGTYFESAKKYISALELWTTAKELANAYQSNNTKMLLLRISADKHTSNFPSVRFEPAIYMEGSEVSAITILSVYDFQKIIGTRTRFYL
jgi:hypothetical protein